MSATEAPYVNTSGCIQYIMEPMSSESAALANATECAHHSSADPVKEASSPYVITFLGMSLAVTLVGAQVLIPKLEVASVSCEEVPQK